MNINSAHHPILTARIVISSSLQEMDVISVESLFRLSEYFLLANTDRFISREPMVVLAIVAAVAVVRAVLIVRAIAVLIIVR